MSAQPFEHARATMIAIVEHARADPQYAKQLKALPMATVEAAGLAQGFVTGFAQELGLESGVAGHLMIRGNDCPNNCCCTHCLV